MNTKKYENSFDNDGPSIEKTFVEGNTDEQLPDKNTSDKQIAHDSCKSSDILPSGMESIVIGSGKLCGLLGCGGMSKVYKIWNEKLEIFRAVKILLPGQSPDLKDRFETEAKISAKLHHPNIIEIYNVGEWKGLPYLEMEYIDGEPLDSLIMREGRFPDDVCCSIALSIARALSYAHASELLLYGKEYHGIIHRDLKPANIMISNSGNVKLMDFGIARPAQTSLHTIEGNLVGTLQYLSPEQMDGINIDCRTDIYSFGTILYEMLTGTKTFPQDSITELMKKKIVNDYRRLTDFGYKISPDLAKITQKCLHINKNERFGSAEILIERLEEVHKKLSVSTPVKTIQLYLSQQYHKENKKIVNTKSSGYIDVIFSPLMILILLTIFYVRESNEIKQTDSKTVEVNTERVPKTIDSKIAGISPDYKTISLPLPDKSIQNLLKNSVSKSSPDSNKKEIREINKNSFAKIDPLDKLRRKYSGGNLLNIGETALRSGAFTDAIKALEASKDTFPDQLKKNLLLLEAYIESGRINDAVSLKDNLKCYDSRYDFLCGKLNEISGKLNDALDSYQKALTKPCAFGNRTDIRNDALYRSALIRSEIYKKNADIDNRNQAINAWNSVKLAYSRNTLDFRFIKASEEIANLK
jgi:serine/threonine protein kinase